MFNFFFGSDARSIPYLKVLHNKYNKLDVITTEPKISGRGQKTQPNPVEVFCIENEIPFNYFSQDSVYSKMTRGLCVSFGKIFSDSFISSNAPIYNIHLSLLPSYVGPSPVETSILNQESVIGISLFEIDKNIDKGRVVYQEPIQLNESMYSSDIYRECVKVFDKSFDKIANTNEAIHLNNNLVSSKTRKFIKSDFSLETKDLKTAKLMIRAFDTIGPAFIRHNEKYYKIHKFTNDPNEFPIELDGGTLYPSLITPEGKRTMVTEDYMRGKQ